MCASTIIIDYIVLSSAKFAARLCDGLGGSALAWWPAITWCRECLGNALGMPWMPRRSCRLSGPVATWAYRIATSRSSWVVRLSYELPRGRQSVGWPLLLSMFHDPKKGYGYGPKKGHKLAMKNV